MIDLLFMLGFLVFGLGLIGAMVLVAMAADRA